VIAAHVAALGAGTTVSRAAAVSELQGATRHVLAAPRYRQAARRLIDRHEGAANGATALENYAAPAASRR
jgi:UDP:flavonoid glycosyltransferase YjiC (YdhE family)